MHYLFYYFGSHYDSRSPILEYEHDIIYLSVDGKTMT